MNIHIQPGLALAIGVSLLLVSIIAQAPIKFLPQLNSGVSGGETKGGVARPHGVPSSMRGLDGYWYRGF